MLVVFVCVVVSFCFCFVLFVCFICLFVFVYCLFVCLFFQSSILNWEGGRPVARSFLGQPQNLRSTGHDCEQLPAGTDAAREESPVTAVNLRPSSALAEGNNHMITFILYFDVYL